MKNKIREEVESIVQDIEEFERYSNFTRTEIDYLWETIYDIRRGKVSK